MSSLLNKLKGHGHHDQTSTYPSDSYNEPSSNTGYDNTQSGYADTNSPTHHSETNYGNTPNTSSGYDNGPLNTNSDGGRYYAPKGTHVGQSNNEIVGPHNSSFLNKADRRVDSDQSKLHRNTQQGHGEPGYDQSGYDSNRAGYGNDLAGYGTTTTTTTNTETSIGHDQYGVTHGNTHESGQRLPADPVHPSAKERLDPRVNTDSSRRNEEYSNTGPTDTSGSNQYWNTTHDSNKRLPEDPAHPKLLEKINPNVITDSSRRNDEYGNDGYGNAGSVTTGPRSSTIDSDHHGHHDQYATGAAGAYDSTESSRHHTHPVRNDDSMMNRAHPATIMHPSDRRYDSNRADQTTGPDGEYLPGPAPNTAGPHKSDMMNKLDPRVDSDQSKLEKERERERESYGNTGTSGTTYGNEHERRINEGHNDRRHEDTGTGVGDVDRRDQYSSNSPTTNRDSGYGGAGSTMSNMTNRKPVNETGTYGNDQYSRGNDYDRSNPAGTYNNPAVTTQSAYGNDNDEKDFECAKCGHKNTHLRKNKTDQYRNAKPGLMSKLNPKVDANGDGQTGFMK